jgi:hypothetical protein
VLEGNSARSSGGAWNEEELDLADDTEKPARTKKKKVVAKKSPVKVAATPSAPVSLISDAATLSVSERNDQVDVMSAVAPPASLESATSLPVARTKKKKKKTVGAIRTAESALGGDELLGGALVVPQRSDPVEKKSDVGPTLEDHRLSPTSQRSDPVENKSDVGPTLEDPRAPPTSEEPRAPPTSEEPLSSVLDVVTPPPQKSPPAAADANPLDFLLASTTTAAVPTPRRKAKPKAPSAAPVVESLSSPHPVDNESEAASKPKLATGKKAPPAVDNSLDLLLGGSPPPIPRVKTKKESAAKKPTG